jgi:cell pole-organizing protein PopZ
MGARDQVMSSTERAPEPTMEEILASIRRIISDDESNAARPRPDSATQQADEGPEVAEGDADDKIIDDIARVLSASAPKVEDEEDILDLTAELSGPEAVEEVLVEEMLVEEVAAPLEMPPDEIFPPEPAGAGFLAAEAPPPEPEVSAPPAPPLSASEEAASALERAIAALRAGQVPTSVSEFMPYREPVPEPAPEPRAFTPVSEPVAEPEPVPEPLPELEAEPEPQLVLHDFTAETVAEETVPVETPFESTPEESVTPPSESVPWATAASAPFVEPERPATRRNGGTTHGASPLETSHKSLEDSIKDMLRPMLKQWLDENMARVLTAALKDELGERQSRGQSE